MNPQCACEREGEVYDYATASCAPATNMNGGDAGCCNANSDPCCPYLYCGQSMTAECACELDGGVPDYTDETCVLPADAAADAGASDATVDADIDAGD
jgi:hypothetical protein